MLDEQSAVRHPPSLTVAVDVAGGGAMRRTHHVSRRPLAACASVTAAPPLLPAIRADQALRVGAEQRVVGLASRARTGYVGLLMTIAPLLSPARRRWRRACNVSVNSGEPRAGNAGGGRRGPWIARGMLVVQPSHSSRASCRPRSSAPGEQAAFSACSDDGVDSWVEPPSAPVACIPGRQ